MSIVILPPITITKGIEFHRTWPVLDTSGDPIDVTAWTGTGKLSERPFKAAFYEFDLTMGVGEISATIPVEDIAGFTFKPILGGTPSAVVQLYLVAPNPQQNLIWQGPAVLAGAF